MTKATNVMNTKKKRVLKNINFDSEQSHIALVGPSVGGPANNQDFALIMKSANFSQEAIEKMQMVRVTLELPEFLRKFFGMYCEDAEILARVLGYVPPEPDVDYDNNWYQRYIDDKVANIEIMKQFKDKDLTEILSIVKENDYLSILETQEIFEKGILENLIVNDTSIVKEVEENQEVSTSNNNETLEKSMTKEVEMVEKSVLVTLEKSLEETKTELQKANETIAQYNKDKKEAVRKTRLEKLTAAVKDKDKAEILFKAVGLVESDEEFEAVVKSLAEMTAQLEKSDLFKETGASAEAQEPKKESLVTKAIKANLLANKSKDN